MENTGKLKLSMELSLETLFSDCSLQSLRKQGITYIAVPFSFYLLKDETILERAKVMKDMGFVFDTCHLPFGGGNSKHSVCAEDETVRTETIEMWKRFLKKFELTGMRVTPMHTGGAMHSVAGESAKQRVKDTLDRILPSAIEANTVIALENTFFQNPCPFKDSKDIKINEMYINDECTLLREFVLAYNHPMVRVCHDVGHSNLFGNNLYDDFEALHDLTALYHIHGNDGKQDFHFNVGVGTLDNEFLKKKLHEKQYALPMFVEVLNDQDEQMRPLVMLPHRVAHYYKEACQVMDGE